MASMPSSGPLRASKFKEVFGAGNPVRWSQMYRGGPYVPSQRVTRSPGAYLLRETRGETGYIAVNSGNGSYFEYFWGSSSVPVWSGEIGYKPIRRGTDGWGYGRLEYLGPFGNVDLYEIGRYEYFPPYDTVTQINTGVPTSGRISFSKLYGAVDS